MVINQHPPEPKRRVLRNTQTGLYLLPDGTWTSEIESAGNWPNMTTAVLFCFNARLRHMEMLLQFDDPKHNVALELRGTEI